ncbi:MAG TPA: Wzz/FepE/Etk N-terminal domain-containing protein [Candidatus Sulfopaludibacter sp.]|nr:Wzz/FepE/Etk N-terminal domain-containing protein [Candidatus Sulfopaludibacter sp.]
MNEKRPEAHAGGLTPGDVYFVLFRRKWMILLFSVLGMAGATLLLFVFRPPQYQSDAEISIRYVVEGKSLNPPGDQSNTKPLDEQSVSIINTEIQTLNSLDLAKEVVQVITPERILAKAGGGADINKAVYKVSRGITVEPVPLSSVIRITYQNEDPTLVQPVLNEIIDAYLAKHVQLHQGLGISSTFLTNEIDRLRSELAQTDDQLRRIKTAAGIVSPADTQKAYADQISTIRQNIFGAEAELAERQALLGGLPNSPETKSEITNVASVATLSEAPAQAAADYKRICELLTYLEGKQQNYLTQQGFTMENVLVKQVREQILQNEAAKRGLEEKYPGLAALSIPQPIPGLGQPTGQQYEVGSVVDLTTESEQIFALKAKIRELNSQLDQVWSEATNFGKVEMTISELEQKKAFDESNLKYFMSNQEEAKMDQALGVDKAANISIIQTPSPPLKGWAKTVKKKAEMLAAGGILGGIALAFLIELLLDRSIKRPADIETKLHLPLFISIPAIAQNGRRHLSAERNPLRLQDAAAGEPGPGGETVSHPVADIELSRREHPFRRFSEGLRDRLIVYFETRNFTHKPKLVAVTSCDKGAGVSTISAGLAASLSETGDGNVLLVNISGEQGAAQQFHKGKPACTLDEALANKALPADEAQGALVKAHLSAAKEQINGDMLPANLPKKISALMPKFRASDYDYIIFDMPPVSQTSVTARLSGLMDMVLLVIESERTNQDVVKRVNQLLAESKATVGTVLNKTRNYVPPRLHQEFLD